MTSTTRRPLMAGNWKMFKTPAEAGEFVRALAPLVVDVTDREILLCPPFVSLAAALGEAEGSNVGIGAQTMHFADSGAFTGEVSPLMLLELGVKAVIVGHSERRQYYNENDPDLARKVRAALDAGLMPVLCVGETEDERERGETEQKLTAQLDVDLAPLAADELPGVAIAYEPIWAIGTGKAATGQQANHTIGLIRHTLSDLYGETAAQAIRIQYGGSVTGANIAEFISQPEIDGALVGGASLKAPDFLTIVQYTADAKQA
jgi:triosephosphate isomerase